MQHRFPRPHPRMLVASVALLLASCGGAAEEGLASGEPLGTTESALCSGSSVSNLTITAADSYGGTLSAYGNWTVAYPGNAVRLEYYVDGSLRSYDERPAYTGVWHHSSDGVTCGNHTLQVRAYPMVIDSLGNRVTCLSNGPATVSLSFSQPCPSAWLSCLRTSSTSITCTGSSSGGTGPFTPLWQMYARNPDGTAEWTSSWFQDNWTADYYCQETYVFYPTDQLEVRFKVRDGTGMESYSSFANALCAPGSYF